MSKTFLSFDEEELKIWFLIVANVFAILQLLRGDFITAGIIGVCVAYLFYRENKSEDWQKFKAFVKDFRDKEQRQKLLLKEKTPEEFADKIIDDHKLINELIEDMNEED